MKLSFPEKYKEYDFLRASKRAPDPRVRLRLLGMHHLQNGKSASNLAPFLGVCRQSILKWVSRLQADGISGLYDRPRSGQPPRLPREKEAEFVSEVLELQKKRSGGRLRGSDIGELLERKYQCRYRERSVYSLLRRLNLVWITGRTQHPEASEEEQEAFKKTLLKK
jgi:transposase